MPRGPSVLTLCSAADLLTAPGCPVCRYATEASDRYLGWFALEGHAQSATITRLTAVYRYVVTAAGDRLAGRHGPPAACPACEHDEAAAGRALDTLLEDLADPAVLDRFRELGGLCLPHLAAAAARSRRVAPLAKTAQDTVASGDNRCDWLAGTDHDAQARAVLRRAPSAGHAGPRRNAGWPQQQPALQQRSGDAGVTDRRPARHLATAGHRCGAVVRHHLVLRAAEPRSAQLLAPSAVRRADQLAAELADAFDRTSRAHSTGTRAPESTAWQHAAAFLDGGVFGGRCPPPPAGPRHQ